jgi:hypothetical protein
LPSGDGLYFRPARGCCSRRGFSPWRGLRCVLGRYRGGADVVGRGGQSFLGCREVSKMGSLLASLFWFPPPCVQSRRGCSISVRFFVSLSQDRFGYRFSFRRGTIQPLYYSVWALRQGVDVAPIGAGQSCSGWANLTEALSVGVLLPDIDRACVSSEPRRRPIPRPAVKRLSFAPRLMACYVYCHVR